MYCKKCGKELEEKATFCTECGAQQETEEASQDRPVIRQTTTATNAMTIRIKRSQTMLKGIIWTVIGAIFLIGCIGIGTTRSGYRSMSNGAREMTQIQSKGAAEDGSMSIAEVYYVDHGRFLSGYADFLEGIGAFIVLVGILGGGLTVTKGVLGILSAKKENEV